MQERLVNQLNFSQLQLLLYTNKDLFEMDFRYLTFAVLVGVLISLVIPGRLWYNLTPDLRIIWIRDLCGEMCTFVEQDSGDPVVKQVNCKNMFEIEEVNEDYGFLPHAPESIPTSMLDLFSYLGKGTVFGNQSYVPAVISALREASSFKSGSKVLVLGSIERPWLESILLFAGAAKLTVVEYISVGQDHPRIEVISPGELSKDFLAGRVGKKFDLVVAFSSLQHSGQGRYGDLLNPWGDVIALSQAWCLTKPNGHALIAIPESEKDVNCFNSHRIYGPFLSKQLLANWEFVKRFDLFDSDDVEEEKDDVCGRSEPRSIQVLKKIEMDKL